MPHFSFKNQIGIFDPLAVKPQVEKHKFHFEILGTVFEEMSKNTAQLIILLNQRIFFSFLIACRPCVGDLRKNSKNDKIKLFSH